MKPYKKAAFAWKKKNRDTLLKSLRKEDYIKAYDYNEKLAAIVMFVGLVGISILLASLTNSVLAEQRETFSDRIDNLEELLCNSNGLGDSFSSYTNNNFDNELYRIECEKGTITYSPRFGFITIQHPDHSVRVG